MHRYHAHLDRQAPEGECKEQGDEPFDWKVKPGQALANGFWKGLGGRGFRQSRKVIGTNGRGEPEVTYQ